MCQGPPIEKYSEICDSTIAPTATILFMTSLSLLKERETFFDILERKVITVTEKGHKWAQRIPIWHMRRRTVLN